MGVHVLTSDRIESSQAVNETGLKSIGGSESFNHLFLLLQGSLQGDGAPAQRGIQGCRTSIDHRRGRVPLERGSSSSRWALAGGFGGGDSEQAAASRATQHIDPTTEWRIPPNGSRLSCGRKLAGRNASSFGYQYSRGAQLEFYLTW